jgi:hypothetical protein
MTLLLNIRAAILSLQQFESPCPLVITECALVSAAVIQRLTALAETTTT